MILWRSRKGFTLLEVMITACIFTAAVTAVIFGVLNLMDLGELSNEKLVAIMDGNRVLEQMRVTADSSLTTLRNTNWAAWAQANVINTKDPLNRNDVILPQEAITVAFQGAGNPVQFTMTVTWQHRNRLNAQLCRYQVSTCMTTRR